MRFGRGTHMRGLGEGHMYEIWDRNTHEGFG